MAPLKLTERSRHWPAPVILPIVAPPDYLKILTPMDLNLKGRRALVTGSTAGIGFAIARELALLGATVAVILLVTLMAIVLAANRLIERRYAEVLR